MTWGPSGDQASVKFDAGDYQDDGLWGNSGDGDSGADNGGYAREKHRTAPASKHNADRESEEITMASIEEARRNFERAQEALNAAEAEATRYGPEPAVGTVVTFTRRYGMGWKRYEFAALRLEPGWYLTGSETGTKTWNELNRFANSALVRVATGWSTASSDAVSSRAGKFIDAQGNECVMSSAPQDVVTGADTPMVHTEEDKAWLLNTLFSPVSKLRRDAESSGVAEVLYDVMTSEGPIPGSTPTAVVRKWTRYNDGSAKSVNVREWYGQDAFQRATQSADDRNRVANQQ